MIVPLDLDERLTSLYRDISTVCIDVRAHGGRVVDVQMSPTTLRLFQEFMKKANRVPNDFRFVNFGDGLVTLSEGFIPFMTFRTTELKRESTGVSRRSTAARE